MRESGKTTFQQRMKVEKTPTDQNPRWLTKAKCMPKNWHFFPIQTTVRNLSLIAFSLASWPFSRNLGIVKDLTLDSFFGGFSLAKLGDIFVKVEW
jgi:hypothetical protein